jgi:hypothetical protein
MRTYEWRSLTYYALYFKNDWEDVISNGVNEFAWILTTEI